MRKDILHTDDGDLVIANGDLVVGQSNQQHVADIIVTLQGEWKKNPLLGFGAIKRIKSKVEESEFKRGLKIQLNYDNYPNAEIDLSEGVEKLNVKI